MICWAPCIDESNDESDKKKRVQLDPLGNRLHTISKTSNHQISLRTVIESVERTFQHDEIEDRNIFDGADPRRLHGFE